MRMVVTRRPLKQVLRWTQWVLFAGGLLALGYCGFVLIGTWIFQKRASNEFERRLHEKRAAPGGAARTAPSVSPKAPPAVGPDGLIGRIEIPRIGVSAVVFAGTDKQTLRQAVGHISSTALPGQPGNTGLAGHRDTFFRPLKDIRRNDIITLTTLGGEYRYQVVSTRVVPPTEVSVLRPTANETLTLVTCHPFYFVGAAPNRFIVRADRVTGSAGAPARGIPMTFKMGD